MSKKEGKQKYNNLLMAQRQKCVGEECLQKKKKQTARIAVRATTAPSHADVPSSGANVTAGDAASPALPPPPAPDEELCCCPISLLLLLPLLPACLSGYITWLAAILAADTR